MFKKQEERAFVSFQCKRLITRQDASAASGDRRAGGTGLSRERGFFSLRQDSQPQSHTGQERRVRSWDVWGGGREV